MKGNPAVPHHALELQHIRHRPTAKLLGYSAAKGDAFCTQEIAGYLDARMQVANLKLGVHELE